MQKSNILIFFNNPFYLAIVRGGDLTKCLMSKDRRLPWPWRLAILEDVADGMVFLHRKGMVHCDLKSDKYLVLCYLAHCLLVF